MKIGPGGVVSSATYICTVDNTDQVPSKVNLWFTACTSFTLHVCKHVVNSTPKKHLVYMIMTHVIRTSARCSGLAPGSSKLLATPPASAAAHSFRMARLLVLCATPFAFAPALISAQQPLPATQLMKHAAIFRSVSLLEQLGGAQWTIHQLQRTNKQPKVSNYVLWYVYLT